MPPPPGCSLGSYPRSTLYWPFHSRALVIQVCLCITSLCVLFSATPTQVAYTSFYLLSTQSSSHGLESAYSYLFSTVYLPLVFGCAPEHQSRPASRTRVDTLLTLNKQLWNEKNDAIVPECADRLSLGLLQGPHHLGKKLYECQKDLPGRLWNPVKNVNGSASSPGKENSWHISGVENLSHRDR